MDTKKIGALAQAVAAKSGEKDVIEREDIELVIAAADKNGDSRLDKDEMTGLLKQQGFDMWDRPVINTIVFMNSGSDGKIGVREITNMLSKLEERLKEFGVRLSKR